MRCSSSWSCEVYCPYGERPDALRVRRLAPTETGLELDYAPAEEAVLTWGGPTAGQAVLFGGHGRVEGLAPDAEYTLTLARPGDAPGQPFRLRTGRWPGTVINYLHPRDERYAFSGHYLGSPSLAVLPDGSLVASMDVFAGGEPQDLTLVFGSRDGGATWQPLCQVFPCFWGRLFVRDGLLYLMGMSCEYGDVLIGVSRDGGRSFSAPTVLARGSGRSRRGGFHQAPTPMLEARGRLFTAIEWGGWERGGHGSLMLSAAADSDLLDAASWHMTPVTWADPAWPGTVRGDAKGVIEGNAVEGPDGGIYNILRYCINGCVPDHDRALCLAWKGPDAPQRFVAIRDLPGGVTKFCIRRDPVSKKYILLYNRVTDPASPNARNVLSLAVSDDLIHWEEKTDILDGHDLDPALVGFQYPDFALDGEDLLILSRTALNGAHNFHDSNTMTFHRLEDFRRLL